MSRDLLITSYFVGSFDELALLEPGSRADQGDEVGCVDGAPAGLCGLDELERHCDAGGSSARALGDSLPKSHGGEGGLDRYLEASR